jgi:mono/diheme cytochrome c family protein
MVFTSTQAADINNGKQLHQKYCLRCHQSEMYTRDDRKVKTLEQLNKQVQQCELAIELGWFEEEVEDVTDYLNVTYYLFGIK